MNIIEMNILNFCCKTYRLLRNYKGVPFWVMTPYRRIWRAFSNRILSSNLERMVPVSKIKDDNLIVSLTSFPARIEYVWQVIECMLRQTICPQKVILWLSKEQFPTIDELPISLRKRINDVFEIRLVEGDIRSHKKYYYAIKEFASCKLFLVDDDIYYPTDIIERSLNALRENNNCVIGNYGMKIMYDSQGRHSKYNDWHTTFHKIDTSDYFFGSGGGTLLEPWKMHNDISNIDIAFKLCPTADDVWLNSMARLAGLKTVFIPNGHFLPIEIIEDSKLSSINNGRNKNDEQISNIELYYNTRCFDQHYSDE